MSSETKKKMFTVVLLYPQWSTDDYGSDLYVHSTLATSWEAAVQLAQEMAASSNKQLEAAPSDFEMTLVFRGSPTVVADAMSL